MRRCALVVVVLLMAACGHSGTPGSPSPSPASGGMVSDEAPNVTGSFALGSGTTPASGYEVWIFDQTEGSIRESPLDPSGAFAVPIGNFLENHTYSMHLVSGFRLIADIGVTGSSTMAFVYKGGFGFSLGSIVIPLDSLGRANVTGSNLVGNLGGGFSVQLGTDGSFSAYPVASYLGSVLFGSQLYVFDPETILYSFYNRATNPAAYARDLRRLSRVGGVVTLASGVQDAKVSEATLTQAGPWLATARLPATDDATPENSPLWGANALSKVQSGRYEFSVFSGGMVSPKTIGILRVEPDTGVEPTIPRLVPRGVSFPPMVVAASGSGGTTTTIDYTSTTASNGLTLPLCQSGNVVLDLVPPLDDTGAAIPATAFNRIEAYFDYYDSSASVTAPVKVSGSSLASPYNAAVQDTSITDLTRSWDPTLMRLTFTLGTSVTAASVQELTTWAALFPAKIGSQAVSLVRMRLYYKSATEATVGATAFYVKVGC